MAPCTLQNMPGPYESGPMPSCSFDHSRTYWEHRIEKPPFLHFYVAGALNTPQNSGRVFRTKFQLDMLLP